MRGNSIIILIGAMLLTTACHPGENKAGHAAHPADYARQMAFVRQKAVEGNYNPRYAILVDFNRHSGLERLFVADLGNNSFVPGMTALVAHGSGCGQHNGMPAGFSNEPGSNCSSTGLSVIGRRDWSQWGKNYKYWLEGLDATNNNMMRRIVVLHAWEGIPDRAVYPRTIAMSEGCFTVSVDYLDRLDAFIQRESDGGRLLLYAFGG